MRNVKIASVAAVLAIGLGIFLSVPSQRKTAAFPGDLRDAPAALEQLGYEGSGGLAVPEPPKAGLKAGPLAAARHKAPPKIKEWTVMYYSTTKDQLRYSLVWQLLEMKKIGSTDRVNVVINAAIPVISADGKISTPTVRMALGKAAPEALMDTYIELLMASEEGPIKAALLKPFAADIVSRENSTDTGDWRRVGAFARWAKENYPARRYVFVVYGHGTGFFDPKKQVSLPAAESKGTLRDTDTGNYVTTPELAQILAVTGKVDVLVMQSCIMQMAEVAYQIRNYVDVVVGSSELMWSVGYDLRGMLAKLNSDPGISSPDLGALLAGGYVQGVKDYKLPGGHASALLTAKLPAFAGKIDAWVDAVTALNDKEVFLLGIHDAVRFDVFGVTTVSTLTSVANKVSVAADLHDFIGRVNIVLEMYQKTKGLDTLAARRRGTELMDFISKELVYKYAYTGKSNSGFDYALAHGLSIHVPPVKLIGGNIEAFNALCETNYWDLYFAKDTRWGDFLNWLYDRKKPLGRS